MRCDSDVRAIAKPKPVATEAKQLEHKDGSFGQLIPYGDPAWCDDAAVFCRMMICVSMSRLPVLHARYNSPAGVVAAAALDRYQGWNSPYYNKSHRAFRAAVRAFVDKEITPFVHQWDEVRIHA